MPNSDSHIANYIISILSSGFAFAMLDMVINANPLAQKLMSVYLPISRKKMNFVLGIFIDLFYGFALTTIYALIFIGSGWWGFISYTLLVWFFRVFMSAISNYMMFETSWKLLLYNLVAGLSELAVVIGIIAFVYKDIVLATTCIIC